MPAHNGRFGASGGVAPQKVQWELELLSPAGTFVVAATSPSRWDVVCHAARAR